MTFQEHLNTAAKLLDAGEFIRAIGAASSALAIAPNHPDALRVAGLASLYAGRPETALVHLRRAMQIDPDNAYSHGTLASALAHIGYVDDAWQHARRAVEIDPNYADGQVILGIVLTNKGLLHDAADALNRAISLRPNDTAAYNMLGNALLQTGRCAAAIDAYRRSVQLNPANRVAHDNLLMALNHHIGHDGQSMFDEHRRWAAAHAEPFTPPRQNVADVRGVDRVLKIAYLSPDFRQHAVMRFFEPLLRGHDRSRFHVTLYAELGTEDEVSQRVRALADAWVRTTAMSDDELARRIRQDQIDIAIDLAGHTAGNRLAALARRAAPVQMSYLGYPNTTGMSAIDYVVTDRDLDPPGTTDRWHTEKLIRLPRTMHCYLPPAGAPAVTARRAEGTIRFGSFNRIEKLSDISVHAWARVLGAIPESDLTIKSGGLADEKTRAVVVARFAAHGLDVNRLRLLASDRTEAEHLARYAEIDVALDSFPYSGTTTTCEALWMGVPVVTLAGPTRVARTSAGILRALGLEELIAADVDGFVSIACRLAGDLDRLNEIRAGLRKRMQASPLLNCRELSHALEASLLWAWKLFVTSDASTT